MIGSARSPRPHEKGGVALTLAGLGVIAAGFALPRDAGRRPALQENWPEVGVPVPARHPFPPGYGPRREPLHGLPVRGFAALSGRDAGRGPPPGGLAGAPLSRAVRESGGGSFARCAGDHPRLKGPTGRTARRS